MNPRGIWLTLYASFIFISLTLGASKKHLPSLTRVLPQANDTQLRCEDLDRVIVKKTDHQINKTNQ